MIWCSLLFLGIFLTGELIHALGVKADYSRKLVHILCGGAIFLISFYLNPKSLLILGGLFSVLMILIYKIRLLKGINGVAYYTLGSPLLPVGATIAAIISVSKPIAFQAAILTITIADPLIWLVFQTRVKSAGKSVAGSAVFGAVTFIIWCVIGYTIGDISGKYFISAALVSGIIAICEYFSVSGTDNLTVPIISAALGTIIF
jgi:dolichol kinase